MMIVQRKGSSLIVYAFLGFILAFPVLAVSAFIYARYGHVPVATADTPFPYEETIVHIPLDARINRQLTPPPFSPTPADFTSGAHVYVEHCAVCHGIPGHDGSFAKWMYPTAPQLWAKDSSGVIGVTGDEPGVSYWKVNNGIRLTGMPSFNHILTPTQMWQVVFLLKQPGQPLSPAVTATFDGSPLAQTPHSSNAH